MQVHPKGHHSMALQPAFQTILCGLKRQPTNIQASGICHLKKKMNCVFLVKCFFFHLLLFCVCLCFYFSWCLSSFTSCFYCFYFYILFHETLCFLFHGFRAKHASKCPTQSAKPKVLPKVPTKCFVKVPNPKYPKCCESAYPKVPKVL